MAKLKIGFRNKNVEGEWFTVTGMYKDSRYNVVFDSGEIRLGVPKHNLLSGDFTKVKKFNPERIAVNVGERFGHLVVTDLTEPAKPVCVCDCGNTCIVGRSNLVRGRSDNCGCRPRNIRQEKFWNNVKNILSDWCPDTDNPEVKKLPILAFRKSAPEPTGIIGFSLVDRDFYEYWKDFPFIESRAGYVLLCADKSVYAKFRLDCKAVKRGVKYKLHHLVFGCTNFGKYVVDHIDSDPKNNLRSNLRLATVQENSFNSHKMDTGRNTSSVYKGVCFVPSRLAGKKGVWKPWKAGLWINNKQHTKYCESEVEAALAYNELARKYHGEFAKLNVIIDGAA